MSAMSYVIEKYLPVPAIQFWSSKLKLQRSKIDILISAKADWNWPWVGALADFKIVYARLFMKNTWSNWFERMTMPLPMFSRTQDVSGFGLLLWESGALKKSFWLICWILEASRIDNRNAKRLVNSITAEHTATESESWRRSKASPNWHK